MYGIVFITDMFDAGEWNIGLPTAVYIGANLQRYIQPAVDTCIICSVCGRSFSFCIQSAVLYYTLYFYTDNYYNLSIMFSI